MDSLVSNQLALSYLILTICCMTSSKDSETEPVESVQVEGKAAENADIPCEAVLSQSEWEKLKIDMIAAAIFRSGSVTYLGSGRMRTSAINRMWTRKMDIHLLIAFNKHGFDSFKSILSDPSFIFSSVFGHLEAQAKPLATEDPDEVLLMTKKEDERKRLLKVGEFFRFHKASLV